VRLKLVNAEKIVVQWRDLTFDGKQLAVQSKLITNALALTIENNHYLKKQSTQCCISQRSKTSVIESLHPRALHFRKPFHCNKPAGGMAQKLGRQSLALGLAQSMVNM